MPPVSNQPFEYVERKGLGHPDSICETERARIGDRAVHPFAKVQTAVSGSRGRRAWHVGNIYNHLTHRIAGEIVGSITPVQEAYVWLCSQIGRPIDDPWSTSVSIVLEQGVKPGEVQADVETIVHTHLRCKS